MCAKVVHDMVFRQRSRPIPRHPGMDHRTLLRTGAFVILLSQAPMPLKAQVVNGSFEQAGQFSLAGWEWTCSDPMAVSGGAPAAGDWAVSKEAGQTQGCFPSYLFQRLTGFSNGQIIDMAAWLRCDGGPACLGAYMGLGRINNGVIELEEGTGAIGTAWTYVMFSDTVELGTGDTLLLVFNSGLIGGPIQPGSGQFDDVSITLAQGLEDLHAATVRHYPDPVTDMLYLHVDHGRVRQVRIHDAQGRMLRSTTIAEGSMWSMAVGDLSAGSYFVVVDLAEGLRSFRFIKR